LLDADFIVSYMIGKGRPGKAAMRLHAMVGQARVVKRRR
jgi:hypothetical protein